MRLREPVIPDWLGYTIAVPIAVAVLPVAAMVGLIWVKRQIVGPRDEWTKWFAWYPVSTGWDGTRWLEFVERRSWGVMADTEYRALMEASDAD